MRRGSPHDQQGCLAACLFLFHVLQDLGFDGSCVSEAEPQSAPRTTPPPPRAGRPCCGWRGPAAVGRPGGQVEGVKGQDKVSRVPGAASCVRPESRAQGCGRHAARSAAASEQARAGSCAGAARARPGAARARRGARTPGRESAPRPTPSALHAGARSAAARGRLNEGRWWARRPALAAAREEHSCSPACRAVGCASALQLGLRLPSLPAVARARRAGGLSVGASRACAQAR